MSGPWLLASGSWLLAKPIRLTFRKSQSPAASGQWPATAKMMIYETIAIVFLM
jgi:hypothetical protein